MVSFFTSPALPQPYVPFPLHTEHHKLRHTCLYTNTLRKILERTHFISVYLFTLSQDDSVDFVTRLQVFSVVFWYQIVGTLLGRIWSMSLSFAVNRKVSELEKCDAGFFMRQESAPPWSVAWRKCKGIGLLLLSSRNWRQAASDSRDLEEADVWLVFVGRMGARRWQETYSHTSTKGAGVSPWWLATPPRWLRVSHNFSSGKA